MRTIFVLAIWFAAVAHAGETIWKWKDANGVTHLSDQPVAGAQRVDIKAQVVATTPAAANMPSSSSSLPNAASAVAYRALEIWKPAQDETIPNSGGQVSVALRVDPDLRAGDLLVLYLDGRKVDGPPNALEYDLQEVPRGTHSVVASAFDGTGKKLLDSSSVTFYVRQASVAQPPVGPALRPRR
jgi:hypothetical protein